MNLLLFQHGKEIVIS